MQPNNFDPIKNMDRLRSFTNRDDIYPMDLFESLFLQAPIGIALIDSLTAQIYEANPAYIKITGYTINEITKLTWIDITHPEDISADLENMKLMNNGQTNGFQMNKRYIRPDGNIILIHMTIAQLKVIDPTKPRHLCMVQEI